MNGMTISVAVWAAMAVCVLALFIYRSTLTRGEDDTLHVEHQTEKDAELQLIARKLAPVDKWGKTLTIIAVVYGLIIALYWSYVIGFSDSARGMG